MCYLGLWPTFQWRELSQMATLRELWSRHVSSDNSVTVEDGENGFWWQPELCTTWEE